jgi:alpha-galactosidase
MRKGVLLMKVKMKLMLLAVAMAIVLTAVSAQATTITGTDGGDDSWNTASNWDAGVPTGAVDAVVDDGVWAQVNNASTPLYSGTLTLNSNAMLTMAGAAGSENAVEGASSITMHAGSEIQLNLNANVDFPAITLAGDATFSTLFGASDWQTDNFNGPITGPYTLIMRHFNGHNINLNVANSYTGGTIANAIDRWKLFAKAAGAFGTGDVTINPRADGRSASLYIDAADAIADTATLYLNGTPGQGGFTGDGSDYVIMNADDTIAGLFVYGVEQPPGDYTSSESWLQGSGTLSVVPINPPNPSPAFGVTVPAGDVELSWTNLPPNVGSDVWVDVWFGTDPVTDFTKVVDAGLNMTSVTVNAPVADTYYWQVNSYLDGSPTGDPMQGTVFTFIVDDTDGDGLPDAYELLYTNPPSPTALNPGDDLEPDGLTNMEEYNLGTEPDNPDTDGDTLQDGPELTGVGLRPPTDPLDADTDDDMLNDGVETNTGTYVSASDTGTDPTEPDCDSDGLKDGVETNTGVFVDKTDTGTHPLATDSDSDAAGDWYEVIATFTDPTDPGDNPGIIYPLPDPDGSTGNTNPVKVYIMSGQSNMVGFGRVGGTDLGTLNTITNVENKFPNLVDEAEAWTVRNDVKYRGVISAIGDDVLMPGFGANSSSFGPELGFGHVMGYYHDEPVLLIKTSIGNRSLGWDCLPPGSPRFDYNGYTYAGYGDGTGSWPIGEEPDPPVPGEWYAGKQYDEYFMDEADWAPAAGSPVFNVTDILDNFASEYPEYATQGFEIAGFVWWQGHKDQGEPYASRYEFNMVNFIKKLRQYYENRYPGNIDPNAPFVLATIAFGGWDLSGAGLIVANAQLAVSGETGNYPEFAGNVKTMEARSYWRDFGPSTQGYHYYHNAETYMLVGDALGRAMVELISGGPPPDTDPPTPDPASFASPPDAVSDTEITMTATTGSDATGPVEYYFDETSGNPGGTDSGWTTDPVYNDTDLSPSTEYTYTVQMRDSVTPVPNTGTVSSPASATTDPAPAVPAAPSGLSATAISKTQIDLDWTDNADNETGFKIERSKRVNTNFRQIDTVGQDVTSYSDTTVKKNTLYYYRVRATNEYGDSDYSNEASAKTPK